jgi:hypothetical protein
MSCPKCDRVKCKHPVSHSRPTIQSIAAPANGLGNVYNNADPVKRYTGRDWYASVPKPRPDTSLEGFIHSLFGTKAYSGTVRFTPQTNDIEAHVFGKYEHAEMRNDGSEHVSGGPDPERQFRDVGMYISSNAFNCGVTGANTPKEPWRLRKANGRPATRRFVGTAVLPARERITWVPDSGKLTTALRQKYDVVCAWNAGASHREIADKTGFSRHQVGRMINKLLSQQRDAAESAPKSHKPTPLYRKDTRISETPAIPPRTNQEKS